MNKLTKSILVGCIVFILALATRASAQATLINGQMNVLGSSYNQTGYAWFGQAGDVWNEFTFSNGQGASGALVNASGVTQTGTSFSLQGNGSNDNTYNLAANGGDNPVNPEVYNLGADEFFNNNHTMTLTLSGLPAGTSFQLVLYGGPSFTLSTANGGNGSAANPVADDLTGSHILVSGTTDASGNVTGTLNYGSGGSGNNYNDLTGFQIQIGSGGGGSAPAAPANLMAAAGNASVALSWTASSGATGYSVYRGTSSGGESATPIATGVTSTSYTDSSVTNGTTYYYEVTATNSSGASGYSNEASATPSSGGGLPSPWANADVGSPGAAGSASYSGGTFTLNGSGADIWTTTDAFQYVYQQVSGGTYSITAEVLSQTNTSPYAKAGVMIRSDLTAGSAYAMVDVTPSEGVEFSYRTSSGASAATAGASGAAPYWVRVTGSAGTFTAYASPDGTTWTPIGSPQTITMGGTVYIGLIACSHDAGVLTTATINNVTVGSGGGGGGTILINGQMNRSGDGIPEQTGAVVLGSSGDQWNYVSFTYGNGTTGALLSSTGATQTGTSLSISGTTNVYVYSYSATPAVADEEYFTSSSNMTISFSGLPASRSFTLVLYGSSPFVLASGNGGGTFPLNGATGAAAYATITGTTDASGAITGNIVPGSDGYATSNGFQLQLGSGGGGGVTAVTANAFLNSLGVCTHMTQGADNESNVAAILSYTGIRNIREDGTTNSTILQSYVTLHNSDGTMVNILPPDSNMTDCLSEYETLATGHALLSVEGPNEPNNFDFSYNGYNTTSGGTYLGLAEFQRDLYTAVKGDSMLTGIPVFASSESGGSEPNNVGLQFLTIPSGSGVTLMPIGTAYADYANCHNYMVNPTFPNPADNVCWAAEWPTSNWGADGLYSEYGVTWNGGFTGYYTTQLQTLPRVTTETGWYTTADSSLGENNPVSQDQQGKLFLNLYLTAVKEGWSYTFIYYLHDTSSQGYWGLVNTDYSYKDSATYLHNLTTILADTTNFTPGAVNYTIPSEPSTVHDLLIQKSNGTYYLAVWDDRPVGEGTDNVTVNLGATYAVTEYDPTVGTSGTSEGSISSISLTLSDHPIILQL